MELRITIIKVKMTIRIRGIKKTFSGFYKI
jgi:hypothetical protein